MNNIKTKYFFDTPTKKVDQKATENLSFDKTSNLKSYANQSLSVNLLDSENKSKDVNVHPGTDLGKIYLRFFFLVGFIRVTIKDFY